MLSSWQVVVNRYPRMGETVRTTTAPYEFRGFLGMRNFTMDTLEGERLAYANTIWSNINFETGRPEKLKDEDIAGYELSEKLVMEYAPRKIALPGNLEAGEAFAVQKHHLDTNHHVNNCQYVRMAADYLPEGFSIHQMRAEYKKQAVLNDVFYPLVGRGNGKVTVVLGNEQGAAYAVVEFTSGA